MILTGENQRTWRKACPSATLFTTDPTWTAQVANPGLHNFKECIITMFALEMEVIDSCKTLITPTRLRATQKTTFQILILDFEVDGKMKNAEQNDSIHSPNLI
jgi:hypothetical protein